MIVPGACTTSFFTIERPLFRLSLLDKLDRARILLGPFDPVCGPHRLLRLGGMQLVLESRLRSSTPPGLVSTSEVASATLVPMQ